MHVHDLQPAIAVRDAYFDLPVKSPASAQCRIYGVGTVGRSYNDDPAPGPQAVHEREQLGHNPAFYLSHHFIPLRGDGIDLIDEYNGRCILFGILEHLAELVLTFSIIFRYYLRTADGYEIRISFAGYSPGYHGLTGARLTIQQHTFRGIYAKFLEYLRMFQGKLYHFPNHTQLAFEAAYILVGDVVSGRSFFQRFFPKHYLGVTGNYHRSGRFGGQHCKCERIVHGLYSYPFSFREWSALNDPQDKTRSSYKLDRLGRCKCDTFSFMS